MPTRPLVTRYADDLQIFPDMWHKVGLVLGLVFVLAFPFWAGDQWLTIGNLALIAVVGSVALMILTGFCGQISLGHAAFLALGAYTAGVLGNRYELPFWLILPVAGAVSAAVGLAIGAFALRLRGLHLAIVTIGLLYLVHHVLLAIPQWTGGMSGLRVPIYVWFESAESAADIYEAMDYGPITLEFPQKLYFIFLVIAVLVAWSAKNLHRTNAGRAMMAVRDRDLAAATLGVNAARAKIMAFGISSFIAGMAGAMFAMQQRYITVEPFHLHMSVQYIAMIVLGGIGSVFGAVAGAVAFTVLTPLAEKVGPHLPFIDRLSSGQQSTVLFSLLVIIFLVIEPLGLFGIWLRIKRYFMAWPFSY
jgi:branched-chain amino acid transport system permease protein